VVYLTFSTLVLWHLCNTQDSQLCGLSVLSALVTSSDAVNSEVLSQAMLARLHTLICDGESRAMLARLHTLILDGESRAMLARLHTLICDGESRGT